MSSAVKGLLLNEWKMMKGFFIGQFIVLILMIFVLSFDEPAVSFEQLIDIMILGVIVMPAAMIFSLNMETNQRETFLHNPHSIHKLLAVKGLYGLFAAFSLFVVFGLIVFFLSLIDMYASSILHHFMPMVLNGGSMLIVSIYPTVLLLFLWALHQTLRTRIGGGISLVSVFVLLIAGSKLLNVFVESSAYETITHWGSVSDFLLGPDYIGNYLFYAVVTALLYFISTYLIECKVEA